MQLGQLEEWFRKPDKELERFVTFLPENAERRMEVLPVLTPELNRWNGKNIPRSLLISVVVAIGRILQYASYFMPPDNDGESVLPIREAENALLRLLGDKDLELVSCAIYALGLAGRSHPKAVDSLIHLSNIHESHPRMQLRVAQSLYWITGGVPSAVLARIIEHGLLDDLNTKWIQKPKLSGT
ncbi:MAG: hypothetical protein ACK6A7_04740 [Planctomycetota bacterium]